MTNLDDLFDLKLNEFLNIVVDEANKRLQGTDKKVKEAYFVYGTKGIELEFTDGTESGYLYIGSIEGYIEELVNNGL